MRSDLLALWLLTSPWMLFWALAAVVPVLIHLWSRRKYDEVPWAAMRFLLAAIRKNARRWRIEQLILMAVRVFILVLLAIALADPVAPRLGGSIGGGGRSGDTHHVLVLDASYSMDYRPEDATRFQLAKGIASELVRQSMQGDGFTLIQLADPPRVVVRDPVFDPESMVAEIARLKRTDGDADLEATLAEVERVLDRAAERDVRLHRQRVCFFTDLGLNTWEHVAGEAILSPLNRMAEKNVVLKLYDIGQDGGQNVAVTRLSAADGMVTVGSPTRLNLELENFGNQDYSQQPVDLLVDGQRVAELKADIAAGSRCALSAIHRFQAPGDHTVEVRLRGDRLEADNRRWLSLNVKTALDVLCVEGKSGSARHVVLALSPSAALQSPIRPVTRSEIAILEEDLRRYDCVFLCNVGRFGSDEGRLLHRYLEEGGGLVFILGDQVQGTNYNAMLGQEAPGDRVFSVRLGVPVDLGEYFFDPLDYRHPITQPFAGHERAGLLTTPVWKYMPLEKDAAAAATTALAFQNGDPAIVVESIGNGCVIVVATDASSVSVDRSTNPPTPWSALATWPSFPPLVHQMLQTALRGHRQMQNVLVGSALHGSLPTGSSETSVLIADPAGRSQRVPVKISGNLARWTYTETMLGGAYTVTVGDTSDHSQLYAVNLDTSESRLERFDPDGLPAVFRREPAADGENGPKMRVTRPFPLFRYVLAGVLALLLCEMTLACLFGRATTGSSW